MKPDILVLPKGACPRCHHGTNSVRADGALWCHRCNGAFFPAAPLVLQAPKRAA